MPSATWILFIVSHRNTVMAEADDNVLLLFMEPFNNLFFFSNRVYQRLTVTEIDLIGDIMYRHFYQLRTFV